MSHLENALLGQIKALKLQEPERGYRFAALHVGMGKGLRDRLLMAGLQDWRFDFAWPDLKLAAECEGGAWAGGRHTRGSGFAGDLRKYDAAMRLGWTVYRCDGGLIQSGHAVQTITMLMATLRAKA